MNDSISKALYYWMHKRRIISTVAQNLGVDESHLSAKLRAGKNRSRLSADDLIPLCEAIRESGYGQELKGLLHPYLEQMYGEESLGEDEAAQTANLQALGKSVSTLFDCAARVSRMTDADELKRLKLQVRTEVLPVVLQMEALLEQRLKKVTTKKPAPLAEPYVG